MSDEIYTMPFAPHCPCLEIPRCCSSLPRLGTPKGADIRDQTNTSELMLSLPHLIRCDPCYIANRQRQSVKERIVSRRDVRDTTTNPPPGSSG